MAWDGNGNFLRLYSWVADKANGVNPSSLRFDNEDNGFATAGFGNCVTRDAQGKMTASFLPATDNTYDLGSGGLRWRNLLVGGNVTLNGAFVGTGAPANPAAQFSATDYQIDLFDSGAPVDQKHTFLRQSASNFTVTFLNDALAAGNNVFQINRSGNAATSMTGFGPVAATAVDMTPDRSSWTTTLSGPYTSNPTGTLKWSRIGAHCMIWAEANIEGTTTSAAVISASGVPAAITPAAARSVVSVGCNQRGVNTLMVVTVNTNNTLTITPIFTANAANPTALNAGPTVPFDTATGSVGIPAGWSIEYSL